MLTPRKLESNKENHIVVLAQTKFHLTFSPEHFRHNHNERTTAIKSLINLVQ